MKKTILIFISVIVVAYLSACGKTTENSTAVSGQLQGTISLSGAWALYPMAVTWSEEFKKINPEVTIDISAGGAGKGMTDALADIIDIGMVSRDLNPEEIGKGAFAIAVTKDAVVATINANNPFREVILQRGMTRQQFADLWISGQAIEWEQITGIKTAVPITVFTRSDACGAAETWAKYLGSKQENLKGVGVYGDPGVAEAVRKDVNGIGFNNIGFAYDISNGSPVPGLIPVPIDLNANGLLDADEKFYENISALTQAIAAGRYPSPPARDLFFVTHNKPVKPLVTLFIQWVLTDGQKFVPSAGYINLPPAQLEEQMNKLR